MFAGDLAEDGEIPRNNRQAVLSGFDQGEAEALAFRGDQQGARGVIDLFEHFVADALQPEQTTITFGMPLEAFHQLVDHPALLAHDQQIGLNSLGPKQLHGLQGLAMPFAWFERTNHEEGHGKL